MESVYTYNRADIMSELLESQGSNRFISREEAVAISEAAPTTINIDFCHMGIGGLKDQMISSRIIPQSMREKYDVKDIRGILLHGPPGA